MKSSALSRCLVVGLVFAVATVHAQRVSPKPLKAVSPGYPEALTDTGATGNAMVSCVVKADGSVADAVLASADNPAFGTAAMAVIGQWTFQPGTVDGQPADMKVTLPFHFVPPFEQQVNVAFKRKVYLKLPEPALTQKEFGAKLKTRNAAKPVLPKGLEKVDEKVAVKFVVAPDGTTVNPTFPTPPRKELVGPALRAIAMATYEPPVKNGKPVYVEASTTLHFTEQRAERPERRRGRGGGGGDFGGFGGERGGGDGGFGGGGGGGDGF